MDFLILLSTRLLPLVIIRLEDARFIVIDNNPLFSELPKSEQIIARALPFGRKQRSGRPLLRPIFSAFQTLGNTTIAATLIELLPDSKHWHLPRSIFNLTY